MSEVIEVSAQPREIVGKANRRLAADGRVPAVLYGAGRKSAPLSVDRHDFEVLLSHHEGIGNALLHLKVKGQRGPINAIIKEVQRDRVKGTLYHVDFWAVKMDQLVQTVVPLHFLNEEDCAGVRAGGIMTHNLREVRIEALPADLPEAAEADVTGLEVGDSMHVRDITPPEGVTLLDDPDIILCSVTAPTVAPTLEEVERAPEPEVIGEAETEE